MHWVNSGGGPLICAEEYISVHWMGLDGLSASSSLSQKNDYERACNAREYLEAIPSADGNVLILGDEPLQSCFFQTGSGDLAIARWVYAQSRDYVEEFLARSVADRSDLAPPVPFEITQGKLILFDSALRGVQALANCAKVDVQPRLYRVTTERWQLERKFNFIVHRLRAED